jgi:hypothetical protein
MFLLTNFCGKFLDAVGCEKGPEIGIENYQIQQVVKRT